jgi:hypothetical protein
MKPRKHTMPDDNVQVQREVEDRMGIGPCDGCGRDIGFARFV